MSVNNEDHVLGLWLGGGVTPAALRAIGGLLEEAVAECRFAVKVRDELTNIANGCYAQLSKLPEPPKPDWSKYL